MKWTTSVDSPKGRVTCLFQSRDSSSVTSFLSEIYSVPIGTLPHLNNEFSQRDFRTSNPQKLLSNHSSPDPLPTTTNQSLLQCPHTFCQESVTQTETHSPCPTQLSTQYSDIHQLTNGLTFLDLLQSFVVRIQHVILQQVRSLTTSTFRTPCYRTILN